MSTFAYRAGTELAIGNQEKIDILTQALNKINRPLKKVLLLPPDMTRLNSDAGFLTAALYRMLSPDCQVDIMPALGTHVPMKPEQLRRMFGPDIPLERFFVHDWRNDVVTVGEVPGEKIREWSEGRLDYPVQVQCNKKLFEGYDLIFSIGQIVPHEVVGMANYTKNIMVGVGGSDMINKSHFLGASYGMERIMGRNDSPVRRLFNYGTSVFLKELPIVYVLTVMAKNQTTGAMDMKGLFVGDDEETFAMGVKLSQQTNLDLLDRPLKKVVVFLDPEEFKSTWLGNKAVYRTRMAIADGGELIILAPGLRQFGEDPQIDKLIRKYGYKGTPATLKAAAENEDLRGNLSAAAHLIHGSSEGRFRITYCSGGSITDDEIKSVGFDAVDYQTMSRKYNPDKLKDGFNIMDDGEEIFYISNPALGLWALKEKFQE